MPSPAASSLDAPIDSTLEQFAARTLAVDEVRLERLEGGASRAAYLVYTGDRPSPAAFLRVDDGSGGLSDSDFDLPREGALLRSLGQFDLPVPAIYGELASPPALLMEAIGGVARLTAEEARVVGPVYMRLLARVHEIDPAVTLPDAPCNGQAALDADLQRWEKLARNGGAIASELISVGLQTLQHTRPDTPERAIFLHGDAGAGNFLTEHGTVTGLLDWEMAHTGDFHEDLAWVCLRTIFTPFGAIDARLAEYEAASGRTINPATLRWYQMLVVWKCLIAVETTLRKPDGSKSELSRLIAVTYSPALTTLGGRILRGRADPRSADLAARLARIDEAATLASHDDPVATRVLERARTRGMLS